MDNPVQETIDERIIKLLGLESEFEMSYGEYIRHLKEAMVEGTMVKSKFSSEEFQLFENEWKRVRNKNRDKRFTIKIKKTQRKLPTKQGAINFLKPGKETKTQQTNFEKEQVKQTKVSESILDIVISIRKSVDEIFKNIKSQNILTKKSFEKDRKERENKKRKEKEDELEGTLKKVGSAVSKLLSPIQGILDKIFRFITFTLLGQALKSLFEWLKDPENKKKFKSLIRFFTDRWKLFVGLFILFGTSFGSFVRGMLKAVARGLISLAINIPRIKRFLKRNPKLAMLGLGAATYGTGLIANTLNPPEAKSEGDELKGLSQEDFARSQRSADKASNVKVPALKMGGFISNISLNVGGSHLGGSRDKVSSSASKMSIVDGIVGDRGIPFTGGGKDNRLFPTQTGGAVGLSGNEFIVNEGGVTKETLPILMAFNRMGAGSGANKPKMINSNNIKIGGAYNGGPLNVLGYNQGGLLGNLGGMMNQGGNFLRNLIPGNKTTPKTSGSNPKSPSPSQKSGSNPVLDTIRNLVPQGFPLGRPASATPSSLPTTQKIGGPVPEHKTPEVQSLLRSIKFAEHYGDTKDPYNVLQGRNNFAPITQMTVQEVINMYDTKKLPPRLGGTPVKYGTSGAAGAYQFMPFTLEDLIRRGKVKNNQIMTSDLQDRLGWELAKSRGVTIKELKEKGLSSSVVDMIAPEWASFPNLFGPDAKGRVGTNASYYGQPSKPVVKLQQVYNEHLQKTMQPPGPPVRRSVSSITLPPTVIDNAKNMATSSISNEGDPDMVANIYPTETRNKAQLLKLV